jgi:hypothetical protein
MSLKNSEMVSSIGFDSLPFRSEPNLEYCDTGLINAQDLRRKKFPYENVDMIELLDRHLEK